MIRPGPGRAGDPPGRTGPPADRRDLPEHSCDVLIIGGGPTGLFLAALLAQRGVDAVVLERRHAPSVHSRAIGLHPPALNALGALDLDGAALAQGTPITDGEARSRGRCLGEVDFEQAWPQRPYVLALPQSRTEALLTGRLAELAPGALHGGWEVTGLDSEGGEVAVSARRTADGGGRGARWRARVVVGADGSRSTIRDLAAIPTSLATYPDTYLMGDLDDPGGDDRARIYLEPDGVVESFPLPGAMRRWVVHTGTAPSAHEPSDLARLVEERIGKRLDPSTTTMISAFSVRRRTARRMVDDRVVLIGDAAHEVSPIGGQGMTLGWLDALRLAPLLGQVVDQDLRSSLRRLPAARRFERDQLRIARRAGRLAHVNMALGRPLPIPLILLRDAAIRAALATPARSSLARAYSMAWASRRRVPPRVRVAVARVSAGGS